MKNMHKFCLQGHMHLSIYQAAGEYSLDIWYYGKKTTYEPCHEKTNNVVLEQVRHKPSCTSTEDG